MTVYRFPIDINSITIFLEGLPRSWRKIASREFSCSILAAKGVLERSVPEVLPVGNSADRVAPHREVSGPDLTKIFANVMKSKTAFQLLQEHEDNI